MIGQSYLQSWNTLSAVRRVVIRHWYMAVSAAATWVVALVNQVVAASLMAAEVRLAQVVMTSEDQ